MRRRGGAGGRRGPVRVGPALQNVVRQLGISRKLSEYGVITRWEEIVGEQIARVAVPERIENGILLVRVSTAPWRGELAARRREILEKINGAAGGKIVRDIRFR